MFTMNAGVQCVARHMNDELAVQLMHEVAAGIAANALHSSQRPRVKNIRKHTQ
jgi:hypothetical protein